MSTEPKPYDVRNVTPVYVDDQIHVLQGEAASQRLAGKSDARFLTDRGILQVPRERWLEAQRYERKTWMQNGAGVCDDRNHDHLQHFDGCRALAGHEFESVAEFGCGPFTNLRLILPLSPAPKRITLLDPLIADYLQHPHCTYKHGTFCGMAVELVASPIEEFVPREQFDLLVMVNVLEHCFDVPKILDVVRASLKPGGVLVFGDNVFRKEDLPTLMARQFDAGHPIRVTDEVVTGFLRTNFSETYEKRFFGLYDQPHRVDVYFIGKRVEASKAGAAAASMTSSSANGNGAIESGRGLPHSKTPRTPVAAQENRTIHFVYSGDPRDDRAIRAPATITNRVFRFLEQHGPVKFYDWQDTTTQFDVRPQDIVIGHPHPHPDSAMRRLLREPCAGKFLLFPFHSRLPEIARFVKEMAPAAQKLFLISGPYWTDTIGQTEYEDWESRIVRLDNAVDLDFFAFRKPTPNSPGRRSFFLLGRSGAEKGTTELFRFLAANDFPCVIAGEYTAEDLSLVAGRRNITLLGPFDWRNETQVSAVIDRCDYFLNFSVSDASPTTLFEAMAVGLVPITTAQCGYMYPGFLALTLGDERRNHFVLTAAQELPDEEYRLLQQQNRQDVEANHNWKRFTETLWKAVEETFPASRPNTLAAVELPKPKDWSMGALSNRSPVSAATDADSIAHVENIPGAAPALDRSCWCGGALKASVHPLYGQCKQCGTQVLRRAFSQEELKAFYTLNHYWHDHQVKVSGYPAIEQRAENDFRDRIPVWYDLLVQAKADASSLLEIGCAHGGFLHYCRQRGIAEVVGVEVDEQTCKFAREHFKLPHVCSGLFPDVSLPREKFEAIVGFDVIEHFLDPLKGISSVRQLLAPDGVFVFQTPCYRGEDANWVQFRPTEHTFLHTAQSIRTLFDRAGLEVLHILPGHFPDDMFVIGKLKTAMVEMAARRDGLDRTAPGKRARSAVRLNRPDRMLWVRTDAIGDAVLASSMLPHIRAGFPTAQIAVLCQEALADFYAACPHVQTLICFNRQKAASDPQHLPQIVREIAQFSPDVILNSIYSRDAITEVLTLSCRGAVTVGIESDLSNIGSDDRAHALSRYTHLIPSNGDWKTELARHGDFLAGLGIHSGPLQPTVWTTPDDEAVADAFFKQEQLESARTIALFPGAQHDCRVYPHYAKALRDLNDFRFVIFGGPEVEPLGNLIARDLRGTSINLAGRTTLREMAALLKRCRLYVGAESAGAHIACAVGVPNVVLMGGGHFGRFMPYSPLTTMAGVPLDCYGCNWRCKFTRAHCVKDVSPAVIGKAIRIALEKSSEIPRFVAQGQSLWQSHSPKWQQADKWLPSHGVDVIAADEVGSSARDGLASAASTQPLVTAIVSTYNSEQFIRGCLETLVAQTLGDRLEIVVIDSGSTQNERATVEEFQKRYRNIRYLRTEREPLYAAWNRGISLAHGKFVVNANTDDGLRPDAYEVLAAALEAHPGADLAYADCAWTAQPNDHFPSAHVLRTVVYPSYHPALPLFYCYTGCVQFWRRSAFERMGLFDTQFKAVGDYEMLVRLMKSGGQAVHVPELLSLFYQNSTGISQQNSVALDEDQEVRRKAQESVFIEHIFAVNDAPSRALAWSALANITLEIRVPWLDEKVSENAFAFACLRRAIECDRGCIPAIRNLAVLLRQDGSAEESATVLSWLPAAEAAALQEILDHGERTFQRVVVEPAVPPIEYKPQPASVCRVQSAEVSNLSAPAAHAIPQSKVALPVRWYGPLFNPSGYASELINFVLPLASRVDLGIKHHTVVYSQKFVDGLPPAERRVLQALCERYEKLRGGIAVSHNPAAGFELLPDAAFQIGRTMYETDRIPQDWAQACNRMDEVWVPSQFNVESFAASGVLRDKLVIIPGAVDAHEFDPAIHKPYALPNPAAFNFLSIFEWSSRKAWDVLLAAYLREFSAEDDVCLFLRTYLFSRPETDPRQAIERRISEFATRLDLGNKALPRIEILADQVAGGDLPGLYMAADCLVAPSRGEGWGRPQHEAMAMARPVIATNWSATTEFMTSENSYLLDYELIEARLLEPELWHYRGHRWAQPSERHLRELMRRVHSNPGEARLKGERARADVVARFSREAVAEKVEGRLREIERRLFTPALPAVTARQLAAAKPIHKPNTRALDVTWEGSFLDLGSLSHVNREFTRALAQNKQVHVTRVSNATAGQNGVPAPLRAATGPLHSSSPNKVDVTVRHAWPPNFEPPKNGACVLMQPWEYGAVPQDWVCAARNFDEIWAYSEYVRRVWIESGIDPSRVHVVPLGIDPAAFHPNVPSLKLPTAKRFKFLFVGGTIHRKGADLLLRTYLESFTAADDVCLVIKDFGGKGVYAGQTIEAQIRAAQTRLNAPEILHLTEELPPETLPALYTACDCLVHPYRGEGFGLPVLEAMACGLPVVVTGGGSTDDFATDEFAYRIPAVRKSIGCEISAMKLARPGSLLEPSVRDLAERMQWIVSNRDDARVRGAAASEYVRTHWTWKRSAEVAADRLQKVIESRERRIAEAAADRARKAPAITLPDVARLGNLAEAQALLNKRDFVNAWESTRAAIRVRPFHPGGYLLLAQIADAAKDAQLARRCADYAVKLAPKWKPARSFKTQSQSQSGNRLHLSSEDLFGTSSPKLSVCLITRNEERFLRHCLESIREVASQIVVVDTGSTDRTTDIALEFGAEIHSFPWCDDFSAARNVSLAHATGDWVLILDADEELRPEDRDVLRREMAKHGTMAYRLPIIDIGREDEGCSYVPRLFRNAPGLFFVSRIHEQAFTSIEVRRHEWGLDCELAKTTLLHHGYKPDVTASRDKIARNLRLLEMAIDELPNEPGLLMSFGLELVKAGHLKAGIEQYVAALNAMLTRPSADVPPELRESLLTQFCTHLMTARDFGSIIDVLNRRDVHRGGLTASMHFLLGLAYMEQNEHSAAAEEMRQCLAKRQRPALAPIHTEIRKAGPNHCLAVCLMKLKQPDAAARAFKAALADDPRSEAALFDFAVFRQETGESVEALNLLHEVITLNPTRTHAWELGGRIALGHPEFFEFALDWTSEAIKHCPAHVPVQLQLAEALTLAHRFEAALPLWRNVPKDARRIAALVLCALATDQLGAAVPDSAEAAISREFINWYRRLLTASTRDQMQRINEKLGRLERVLPGAFQLLRAAVTEADEVVA